MRTGASGKNRTCRLSLGSQALSGPRPSLRSSAGEVGVLVDAQLELVEPGGALSPVEVRLRLLGCRLAIRRPTSALTW